MQAKALQAVVADRPINRPFQVVLPLGIYAAYVTLPISGRGYGAHLTLGRLAVEYTTVSAAVIAL